MVEKTIGDESTEKLRDAVNELHRVISTVRNFSEMPPTSLPPANPSSVVGWNFDTFEKYINQRFGDLSLQLRERYEAQQTGVIAALAAAEKAVNAALIAAEKAVDKAEGAQQLRNEAQNEFRKSLSDLSGLMWTIKEGSAAVDGIRREFNAFHSNLETKVDSIERQRTESTDTLRKSLEARIGILETGAANIQGRIWAVSAVWAILVLVVTIAVRFLGHG